MAISPTIISAGIGLLGKLFGGRSRSTTTTNRVDYQYIRDAATAAGFNPAYALRNGGAANATQTSSQAPMGTLDFLGQALEYGADVIRQNDPIEKASALADLDLQRAELERVKAETERLKRPSTVHFPQGPIRQTKPGVKEPPEIPKISITADYYHAPTGTWIPGVNPEAFEVGPSELVTGGALLGVSKTGAKIAENVETMRPVDTVRPTSPVPGALPPGVEMPEGFERWDQWRRDQWLRRWGYAK